MLARRGPSIISISGISYVNVPGNSLGAVVKFRWPHAMHVAAMMFYDTLDPLAQTPQLALSALDDQRQQVFSDGQGTAFRANGNSITGLGGVSPNSPFWMWPAYRWNAMYTRVKSGEYWEFQVQNLTAGGKIPQLLFRVEYDERYDAVRGQ